MKQKKSLTARKSDSEWTSGFERIHSVDLEEVSEGCSGPGVDMFSVRNLETGETTVHFVVRGDFERKVSEEGEYSEIH